MKALFALTLTVLSASAFAIPVAPHDALKVNFKSNKIVSSEYDFEGIVKLSNCSGSLVQLAGQPDTAKGIVMTNGHCIQKPGGYLNPGEVWVNRPISRAMKIFDKNMKLSPINATKILYATMTNTDVAFYELAETYKDIETKFKVRPYQLDMDRPTTGTSIELISGYWDRGWKCDIDGFVFKIKEGNWTFTDSIRYTATCDTMGGTSGSPLIALGTKTVIGINNTSNESGETCTLNNPCEVDEAGTVVVRAGVRYGQQTFNVYSCLTPDFQFDLNRRGCTLPK
ncbi:MAG: serine protease [Bdellovibrionota bacterium]